MMVEIRHDLGLDDVYENEGIIRKVGTDGDLARVLRGQTGENKTVGADGGWNGREG